MGSIFPIWDIFCSLTLANVAADILTLSLDDSLLSLVFQPSHVVWMMVHIHQSHIALTYVCALCIDLLSHVAIIVLATIY